MEWWFKIEQEVSFSSLLFFLFIYYPYFLLLMSSISDSLSIPQIKRKRGFSIFHNDKSSSPSSSTPTPITASTSTSSSILSSSSPSRDKAALRKSVSLPSNNYVSISAPSSPSTSNTPDYPSYSTPSTPTSSSSYSSSSKKSDRAGYLLMHEQSKLLFSKKLESLRASQGDV